MKMSWYDHFIFASLLMDEVDGRGWYCWNSRPSAKWGRNLRMHECSTDLACNRRLDQESRF